VVRGGGEPNWLTLDRFGLEPVSIDALAPSDTAEGNAALVRHAISDCTSDAFRVVLPSAGAAIWTAGLAEDLREAVGQATEAVRSGRTVEKLQAWREAANNS
jgi:anthranilate phosphoribosyltransferase